MHTLSFKTLLDSKGHIRRTQIKTPCGMNIKSDNTYHSAAFQDFTADLAHS